MPELKRPPLAVTVWLAWSLFVKVTRPPRRTLTLGGANAKLAMLTDAVSGAGGGVGRGVETTGGGVGAGVATGVGDGVADGVGDGVGLPTAAGVAEIESDRGAD